jgi:hypothetical protein
VAALLVCGLSATGVSAMAGEQAQSSDQIASGWAAQALTNEAGPTSVQNNLLSGVLKSRDKVVADWRAAQARGERPNPAARPEYVVVWAGNSNASDENTQAVQDDAQRAQSNPLGAPTDDPDDRFVPGLDAFVVIDARRLNVDGSPNPTYGKVVNFVQLPPPWGVEAEPHHMQYQWEDGQPLLAGGLFNDTTFVMDVSKVPELSIKNTITPQDTPNGSVPDAYDYAGNGRFIGTYMGGPNTNYAGSPGEVVTFKPDAEKGHVVASETPAGAPGARQRGNPGGIPEPCGSDEAAPLDTCANPHGVQVRPDIGRMVTSDYAEPKMVVLDPAKPDGGRFFRPTVRVWDTSNPDQPKLVSVAHMARGWRLQNSNTMHYNRGVMENAKTWPQSPKFRNTIPSKGFFAGAMCGGGIFFTPDSTKLLPDSTHQWNQVFDDGIALMAARQQPVDQFLENSGPCEGGAWMQVSRNNRWLFRTVSGQAPNIENTTNRGQPVKVVYDLDVSALVESARDGHIDCNLARGVDTNGDKVIDLSPTETVKRVAKGKQVVDCPRLVDTITVDDTTSGGPHWGAIDNHSLTTDGFPTRMVVSDYFVARSGVDGNHRMYSVNINPRTGQLRYDKSWRDEQTGQVGVDFNRSDWPGNPGAGFYKPHSMVWVCPPGVCPEDTPGVPTKKPKKSKKPTTKPAKPKPPPAPRTTTTWSGTCKMDGTITVAEPYTLVIKANNGYAFMSGTCTGTLDGKPYDGPAQGVVDLRNMNKPMSCELGISNGSPGWLYFGSGSPDDVGAKMLDFYINEFHSVSKLPYVLDGAYNGAATGVMNLHTSNEGLQKCLGEGVKSVDFDTEIRTVREMYG